MGSFSDYAETQVLNHFFKGTPYVQPTHLYVGLSTADPGDDAAGLAEPVGNAYARVEFDTWLISGNSVSNNGATTFPQATGSWGTITHFGIFDAVSGGNMLAHGEATPNQLITTGNTPSFPSGNLSATLD